MDRSAAAQVAIEIAQKLAAREAADPLLMFQLHPKQRAFVDSVLMRQKVENWFIAANRAGKTDAGAYIGATLARFGLPGAPGPTSGWVSALDFPTSRDVLQPKYFDNGLVPAGQSHRPFIPDHEIDDWRIEDQILKLKNGSIIGFKSADSGRRKYQGAEKNWFHMDEEHPFELYEEAVIRVGAAPLIFFCTATILPPEGQTATTSWVFPKIIQPYRQGKLPHIGLFGASIYDNPGIDPQEIKRLEAIYPAGTLSRRIRLEGEMLPGLGGSRAYAAFDRSLHVRDAPPVNHRRPLLWALDFNVEPMCSVVFQQYGETYHAVRELVMDEASIPDMCAMFRYHFPVHDAPVVIYGDATGNRRTSQTGKTDYWIVLQEMKGYHIEMKVPHENPKVPDRINAVNHILLDEDRRVRLLIDPSCVELISDLEDVKRDKKGGILKITNKKDPYFRRTHTSDATGYLVAYEEPVRPPSDASRQGIAIPSVRYGRGR